jgi:hypothetical protein
MRVQVLRHRAPYSMQNSGCACVHCDRVLHVGRVHTDKPRSQLRTRRFGQLTLVHAKDVRHECREQLPSLTETTNVPRNCARLTHLLIHRHILRYLVWRRRALAW